MLRHIFRLSYNQNANINMKNINMKNYLFVKYSYEYFYFWIFLFCIIREFFQIIDKRIKILSLLIQHGIKEYSHRILFSRGSIRKTSHFDSCGADADNSWLLTDEFPIGGPVFMISAARKLYGRRKQFVRTPIQYRSPR